MVCSGWTRQSTEMVCGRCQLGLLTLPTPTETCPTSPRRPQSRDHGCAGASMLDMPVNIARRLWRGALRWAEEKQGQRFPTLNKIFAAMLLLIFAMMPWALFGMLAEILAGSPRTRGWLGYPLMAGLSVARSAPTTRTKARPIPTPSCSARAAASRRSSTSWAMR